MLLFALISLFPYIWAMGLRLNVLFTILLGIVCLYLRDRMKSKVLFWFCLVGIILFSVICDWSVVGILLIFLYGSISGERRKIVIPTLTISAICITVFASPAMIAAGSNISGILMDCGFSLVIIIVIPLLSAYNGKRGYSPPALRYLFYIYYPAHLLILSCIKWLVGF